MGVHAGALHDLGGVAREDVGVVPRVVADDDAGRVLVLAEVRRQSGRRLGDDHPVHPVRAGAELAAQPGRAELQALGEAVLEPGGVVGVDQPL